MFIGADYYPEHWPKNRRPTDAKLMKQAGFNVTRLAEFAWAFMEPREGVFDFSLFDEALALLARNGVSAIMCTPTAVMPAWCARKYPNSLAMQKDGTRIVWGVRKNNCFTSGDYRLLSQRITRAMAEHFAATPNVIGWQTDNEFGGPYCYCDTCRTEFQDWLRNKYGTLDALNRAWGNHFWGHLVSRWDEIIIPGDFGSHNPSACLDWRRFYTFLNVRFQHEQVEILREVCPKHFITHNFMGTFPDLNYYKLAEDLNFVSWDNYPIWGQPSVRYGSAMAADLMRGLKRKNFWIMEQTAGPSGWGAYNRNPRPGEIRSVAYQQLAHGADGMIWFRWRSCTAGREQYWHGLLGHDGKPLRRYKEAARTAGEMHKLAKVLEGTTVKADVAILYDYDSLWATQIQPGYARNDYAQAAQRYYNALFRAGVGVDLISPEQDFSTYKAVFAPDLYIMPDALAKRLVDYVEAGGVLVADCRTGAKDETSLMHTRTLPGLLSQVLGITIEEYEGLSDDIHYEVTGSGTWAGSFKAVAAADWVKSGKAETLARYREWHMKAFAAATRCKAGKGWGYYVGTVIEQSEFYDKLIADVQGKARIKSVVKPPEGVEASVREGKGRKILFLINNTEEVKTVAVPAGRTELLTGRKTGATVQLDRHGVAVIAL